MPDPPCSSGSSSRAGRASAELLPEVGGVADRVVLELRARRSSGACSAHRPAHHLAEHLLLFGEVRSSIAALPGSGLPLVAAAAPGVVVGGGGQGDPHRRGVHSRRRPELDGDGGPAAAGVVGGDLGDRAGEAMRSPGNTESRIRNRMRPGGPGDRSSRSRTARTRPLVGGVEEDVAGAVAVDGEVESWCIGRQSRVASAPSTTVVAVTS